LYKNEYKEKVDSPIKDQQFIYILKFELKFILFNHDDTI